MREMMKLKFVAKCCSGLSKFTINEDMFNHSRRFIRTET